MEIRKFNVENFEKLVNAKGKDVLFNFENIVPKSWNHHKKEYVAIIKCCSEDYDGLERLFISERSNFTGSGANAKLETEEPGEMGTIIEVKMGSHKHMTKTIYRKEKEGWRKIAEREGTGGYFGGGNRTGWRIFE